MGRMKMLASIGLLAALCTAAGNSQEKKIDMASVKYDGLKQEILKHRGKVVVVDFWTST